MILENFYNWFDPTKYISQLSKSAEGLVNSICTLQYVFRLIVALLSFKPKLCSGKHKYSAGPKVSKSTQKGLKKVTELKKVLKKVMNLKKVLKKVNSLKKVVNSKKNSKN